MSKALVEVKLVLDGDMWERIVALAETAGVPPSDWLTEVAAQAVALLDDAALEDEQS